MSIHVCDVLPVTRDPSNFMVSAMMALCGWTSPSRRAVDTASPNRWKHGYGGVLDDLIDARHLQSVFQVPSQEWRGEQYLVATETAHEHAPRSRHDVVFFGVSAHERYEIVAGQTDVFLNTGCISEKYVCNVVGTETSHSINPNVVSSRTSLKICCDVIVHRTWHRRGKAASRHFSGTDLFSSLSTRILTTRVL